MSCMAAGAVVDVGQHQHARRRRASSAPASSSGVDQLAARSRLAAHSALGDVEVGREVAALGDDDAARRRVGALRSCSAALSTLNRFTEVDVGDDHFARLRADQRRDLVADALRQVDPAGACSSCGSGPGPIRAAITSATRAAAARGSAPSELPSR